MTREEAEAWLRGERSHTNLILDLCDAEQQAQAQAWIAQADAASAQQAYYTLLAHREGLV